MSRKADIRAAGAVVLRGEGDDVEVLAVHRPAYDDWSLPKGKGVKDELAPQTAIREVFEETGVSARLGLRLPAIRYKLTKGLKAVEYWRAEAVAEQEFTPNKEVHHTHEGSIGNLCNDRIAQYMQDIYDAMDFDKARNAEQALLKR